MNGTRADRALARAVVVVCCAFLRCMHRYGGQAQAGNPCYWACLLEYALRSLTHPYFYFYFYFTLRMTKPWPDIADSTTPPLATKVKARPSAASTSAPVTRPRRPPGYLSCANVSRALHRGMQTLGPSLMQRPSHALRLCLSD